jgi:sortase A
MSFLPSPSRVLGVVGKVLIGAGIILLLFAAYQVWGTTLQEEHTQANLKASLEKTHSSDLRRALAEATALDKLPTGPAQVAPTTAAPSEGSPIGEIRIPEIGLSQVVVEGTNTDDLRKGPGHYTGTPLPGQAGNSAFAGHRTTYGHPFYSLDAVKKNDPIVLITNQGIFVYDTVRSQVVSPNDTAVLKNSFGSFLTLTTCNPRFSATTRLIVTAQLAHSQLFPNSGLPPGHTGKVHSNDLAGNSTGTVTDAVGWGFIWLVVGGFLLYFAKRFRQRRWWIYGGGLVVQLVLLYYFFTAVTPLLPASF